MVDIDSQISKKNQLLHHYIYNQQASGFEILSQKDDAFLICNLYGSIVFQSVCCEKLTGYHSQEISKMTVENLFSIRDFLQTQMAQTKAEMYNKQGGLAIIVDLISIPIFSEGDVVGHYLVVKPVGEGRNHFLEYSSDGMLFLRDTTILSVNKSGIAVLGAKNEDEVMGKDLGCFFQQADKIKKSITSVKSGDVMRPVKHTIMKVNGDTVNAKIQVLPSIYQDEVGTLVIIKTPVEGIHDVELSMIAERNSTAGQLAAGIAHEIRNPITAIKGFLQLIRSDGDHSDEYYQVIDGEIGRIEEILKELLVLGRPTTKVYGIHQLERLLHQVIVLMKSQALLHNIVIDQHFQLADTVICCEGNQMKQVFINLMKNAIEAMPGGGKVTIETERRDHSHIEVRVIDEGCGIPLEVLKRMGEPFFTTKENGTGLGMLVTKQIIEEHGGTLQIDSDSSGTCMKVILPISS